MRKIFILIFTLLILPSSAGATVTDAEVAAALRGSDDLTKHSDVFLKASKRLINEKLCTLQDLRIVGGWVRRTPKQQRIYITYCGGSAVKNRLYLDVSLGRVFR